MRRISTLVTILITSFVMALCGLTTSSMATASENETVRVSSRFAFGSPMLTNTHKSAIEKAVTVHGTDATFTVIAEAGKLPGVSDSEVKLLAIKRGQVFKSHLVKLGVNDSSVKIKVKMTRIGIVPKTKIVGNYASPSLTTATTVAAPAAPTPTCAEKIASGGTCIVGERGPGGGIVFYVDSAAGFWCGIGFTATGSPTGGLCKYLEVAPSGWSGSGVADPAKKWAVAASGIPGINDDSLVGNNASGIGLGYKNSDLINTQYGVYNAATNNYAAGAARAYAGGSKNDWYLATTAELNLLCQWNHNVTQSVITQCNADPTTLNTGTGATASGFTINDYWSSSEFNANEAWSQIFGNGAQSNGHKSTPGTADIRPIRAF
jgi:hypothetical protein